MGDDLNNRIAKAQAELDAQQRPSGNTTGKGAGLGLRMASDFTAAVIVGAILGWGIDALFHTSPWGLIACLLLGFVTGVRNVVRAATQSQKDMTASSQPGSTTSKGDDA
jgi:ATP synthase protein I